MDWNEFTIKEVKEHISKMNLHEISDTLINELRSDSRSGVQKLADRCQRLLDDEEARKKRWEKMSRRTEKLHQEGYQLVAGIDEAGRGPLAGPVVAAAVILNSKEPIYGLDDSKKLTEKKREQLYEIIMGNAVSVGIGIIDNKTIDKINILQATFQGMKQAISDLHKTPDYILVDGNMKIPGLNFKQDCIVDGDSFVNSIAAASIIAKVTRDRIIEDYHRDYPYYGFDRNKGYGTSEHIQGLKENGPTPIHRFSFSIVNKYHFKHFKDNIQQARTEEELKEIGKMIAEKGLFSEDNLNKLRKMYQDKLYSIVNSFGF
ncbi:MAG: ribonuclease HII [Halanaerobiales bacterium]